MTDQESASEPLGLAKFARLIKFGVVGASGVVINLGVFEFVLFLLSDQGQLADRIFLANLVGVVVSIFWNFMLNDRWTWGDRVKGGRTEWFKRLTKYYVSASAAAVVQLVVTQASFALLWSQLALSVLDHDLTPSLALLTGVGFGMVINFLASHLWAFRDA